MNFQNHNRKKQKSEKNFSVLQNQIIRGLQIGAGYKDYKSRQEGLQIGATLRISNRDKTITNQGVDCKSAQRDFKSSQRLHIRVRGVSNRGRDCKSVKKKHLRWLATLLSLNFIKSN